MEIRISEPLDLINKDGRKTAGLIKEISINQDTGEVKFFVAPLPPSREYTFLEAMNMMLRSQCKLMQSIITGRKFRLINNGFFGPYDGVNAEGILVNEVLGKWIEAV